MEKIKRIPHEKTAEARRALRDRAIDKIEDKEQLKQRLDELEQMSGREAHNVYTQLQLFA